MLPMTRAHRTHQVHLGGDSLIVQGLDWSAQHVYLCEQLDMLEGSYIMIKHIKYKQSIPYTSKDIAYN